MFNYELSADTGSSISNDICKTWNQFQIKHMKIIERMYLGQSVLGDIENDAIKATLIGQKTKRSFKIPLFIRNIAMGKEAL